MKSMPASSAMRASLRLSGQEPDQRSGTLVTARPDEQLAPNKPSLSRLPPCMDMRWRSEGLVSCWFIAQKLVQGSIQPLAGGGAMPYVDLLSRRPDSGRPT